MRRISMLICSLGFAIQVSADEVDIPNQFTAGTPARAAEVNENFDAVEVAVDDNAQRIVVLEAAAPVEGLAVSIDGTVVGRFAGITQRSVDVPAFSGMGPWQVAQAMSLHSAPLMRVISPTGYHFSIATGDFEHPRHVEGNVDDFSIYYDGANCSGSMYRPVQGNTGEASMFHPDTGDSHPLRRWFVRQGIVFASPDPNDSTPLYMVRRGTAVQTVPLASVWLYSPVQDQAVCLSLSVFPEFDPNDPLDVNHTVMAIEAADPAVTGVPDTLGGQILVGM